MHHVARVTMAICLCVFVVSTACAVVLKDRNAWLVVGVSFVGLVLLAVLDFVWEEKK